MLQALRCKKDVLCCAILIILVIFTASLCCDTAKQETQHLIIEDQTLKTIQLVWYTNF